MEAKKSAKKPRNAVKSKPSDHPGAAFAAKKLVAELHHSPDLVGSIVEKGFSPSPAAADGNGKLAGSVIQPTVIPFPVARRRSHGPHWTPVNSVAAEGDDGGDAEDGDDWVMDYDLIAMLADPVVRKEKKGLDFSMMKELLAASDSVKPRPKRVEEKKGSRMAGNGLNSKGLNSRSVSRSYVIEKAENVSVRLSHSASELNLRDEFGSMMKKDGLVSVGSVVAGGAKQRPSINDVEMLEADRQESRSLVDDIGNENLARIQQMSTGEIAEAQAEIMEKMDPAIIETLKRRGQRRLGAKKGDGHGQGSKERNESSSIGHAESGKSKMPPTATTELLPASERKSSTWKTWSQRVEKVREVRFSLDGDVIDGGISDEQPYGEKPQLGSYGIENVAERDLLRSEGDPAAAGYTINEAVALIRSMIPGQRAFALQLIYLVLKKALQDFQRMANELHIDQTNPALKNVDWQAVWAFALGPEPQLALSLMIALDDSFESVVLGSVKAIQAVLSCYTNENYFNLTENLSRSEKDAYTAPIFRSRPELDDGFLHGGYWKYSTKPSNIVVQIAPNVEDDDYEGGPTIQDDVVVAGQDFAAGFVRMGILPRICHLLEVDTSPSLDESLLSVLVAIARHSPTSAHAILKCPWLIKTVVNIFTRQDMTEASQAQIKAITLLKVLSQSSKHICSDFVKNGVFQQVMWHWYKKTINLEQWIANGIEHCRLASLLMVEQLRFWKVCICYGLCITNFADFFPAMCLWLSPPKFIMLTENRVLAEFTSVTAEAYHVLEALAKKLHALHSVKQLNKQATLSSDEMSETWSWSHVTPLVDSATEWLALSNIPFVSSAIKCQDERIEHCEAASLSSILRVISSVLHFLCGVLDRIAPVTYHDKSRATPIPWLPIFVPKVGIEFIKGGFLDFCIGNNHVDELSSQNGCLAKALCLLRNQNNFDVSLSSVSCLQGLFKFAFLVDQLVKRAKSTSLDFKIYESGIPEKILEEGILKSSSNEVSKVLSTFMNIVSTGWSILQPIETFGRGGPAPGVGIGWGSSGGGFWSLNVLLAQEDAHLTLDLLKISLDVFESKDLIGESINAAPSDSLAILSVNLILGVCLIAGPGDRAVLGKAFDLLLEAPMLNYLNICISHLLHRYKGFPVSNRQYKEDDLLLFSDLLDAHYRKRWLGIKRKSSKIFDEDDQNFDVKHNVLETIHEDMEQVENDAEHLTSNSLLVEWAHQRLPLPSHWFLSAICAIGDSRNVKTYTPSEVSNLAKSGLFFLLGLEAISSLMPSSRISVISCVPLVWKLHALSMTLHENMDVLEDATSRDSFEILQQLYGKLLDELKCGHEKTFQDKTERSEDFKMSSKDPLPDRVDFLSFQATVNENYTTFLENIVDQFGAVSYGNIVFGRQIALYLHRVVESTVRLSAWNALSSAYTLELLPPIEECAGSADGYLEPPEDNEAILEAYAKSWTSGMLDRAAARGSLSFTLTVHHLSSFIFKTDTAQKSTLRLKLIKSLLRRSSQKQGIEGMLRSFILYGLTLSGQPLNDVEITRRLELLKAACQGNASLLAEVDNLKSVVQ